MPRTSCRVTMLCVVKPNIMLFFEFSILPLMTKQFFEFNGWLRRHYSIKDFLVLLLKPPIRNITLALLHICHIERRPRVISACCYQIITRRVENLGKLLRVIFGGLPFKWTVSIDNLFYLVEQNSILTLNLSISILLELNRLGVGDGLQVVHFEGIHGPESFTQHLSMLLVILIVIHTV